MNILFFKFVYANLYLLNFNFKSENDFLLLKSLKSLKSFKNLCCSKKSDVFKKL